MKLLLFVALCLVAAQAQPMRPYYIVDNGLISAPIESLYADYRKEGPAVTFEDLALNGCAAFAVCKSIEDACVENCRIKFLGLAQVICVTGSTTTLGCVGEHTKCRADAVGGCRLECLAAYETCKQLVDPNFPDFTQCTLGYSTCINSF